MVDVRNIIKLAMESLPMTDLNEENYHSFLHEIKNMVLDMQSLKPRVMTTEDFIGQNYKVDLANHDERIAMLEERMNILLVENAKLKLLLEDICHEVSKETTHKHKTRRKS
jgi:hypothetical protein